MIIRILSLLFAVILCVSTAIAYDPAHVKQLKKTGHCEGCDLRGLLYVADFVAKSPPSVSDKNNSRLISDLIDANLKGANLSDSDLSGLSLEGANLGGAIFINARLANTNLKSVNLNGANLTGAVLINADLSGAILDKANLSRTNLVGATLTGASLNQAVLDHTDFRYADLSDAKNFSTATLDARGAGEWVYDKAGNGQNYVAEPPSDGCKTLMPSGIRVSYDCDHATWNDAAFQTLGRTQ